MYRQPIPAGPVVFRINNDGRLKHELFLLRLPKDLKGTLDEQLHRKEQRVALPVASTLPRLPRQSSTFAVDLSPGRYGLVCFIKDEDGEQHALKGMNAEFTASRRGE